MADLHLDVYPVLRDILYGCYLVGGSKRATFGFYLPEN
jgi:hypothetical protein